jgi:hypothetical protein
MKSPKQTRRAEGRGEPGGNSFEVSQGRTQSRATLRPTLARVHAAARCAAQTRFTALLHHVDEAALERAFRRQRRQAAAGVDGMTVQAYEQHLAVNLCELCSLVHTGATRRNRYDAPTFRRPTAESARSVSPPWKTRSSRGGRRGTQRDLRGRLPGVLLRLPAGAQPPSGVSSLTHRLDEPARDLGARC